MQRNDSALLAKAVGAAAILGSAVALAAPMGQVPHVFSAGEVISAREMNENFASVVGAIDQVDAKVGVFVNPDTGETWTENHGVCGLSEPTTGDLGGPRGAKDICEATCGSPGAHMCTTHEVLRSYATGGDVGDGWVEGLSADVLDSSGALLNACGGWVLSSPIDHGQRWVTGYRRHYSNSCDTENPVMCCD